MLARHKLTGHGTTTHGAHISDITARVHMVTQNERGGRGWGFGCRTHQYKHMAINSLHTRNSTQHCHTEGREGGKGSKPKWKHSRKETQNSTVCVHTPARNKTTHQVRDSPEGGEGCVWVWVVGDGASAVLGRSHNRHHRAMGFGWNGGRG
jgi:hypothetical protein